MPVKNVRYLILDCFVDEPACLGVPPFIAPYPRYVYGALLDAGVPREHVEYRTIDGPRGSDYLLGGQYDTVFMIGGAVVPGKYLGFRIGTAAELAKILTRNPRQRFAMGGRAGFMLDRADHPNAAFITHDIEKHAYHLARGESVDATRSREEIARWAVAGAGVVRFHPEHPALICEMETYRGCPRQRHCSFCSEYLHRGVSFRETGEILDEVDALVNEGISRFRLGSQPDILQFGSRLDDYREGHPRPEPEKVIKLLDGIRSRIVGGSITLLNVDNANPGTIARFPGESETILEALAGTVTPGDTLALGVESFDDAVIARNNLKVSREEMTGVVDMINRAGGKRIGGVPVLLPGINLIHGLPGETDDTFRINFEALAALRDAGLLVKRINIRVLTPFPGTPAAEGNRKVSTRVRNRFEYYRDRIRKEIDHQMLKMIYPSGTVLHGLRIEESHGGYSYGKQIASYAITAKLPLGMEPKRTVDVVVAAHGERSVLALPLPIPVNTLPHGALKIIPGLGKTGAERLIRLRPFSDMRKLESEFPRVGPEFIRHMEL
jgi:radical SAM superfamily enzyme with C-terminal helix-hairpin-helix motif